MVGSGTLKRGRFVIAAQRGATELSVCKRYALTPPQYCNKSFFTVILGDVTVLLHCPAAVPNTALSMPRTGVVLRCRGQRKQPAGDRKHQ